MPLTRRAMTAGMLIAGCASAPEASEHQSALAEAVAELRAAYDLVSLAAYVSRDGAMLGAAAQGRRIAGEEAQTTPDDRWHIGSCFKSQTATVLARLISRGEARWETTLEQVFPERAAAMHPGARAISLWQLVSSTAGLAENPGFGSSEPEQARDLSALVAGATSDRDRRLRVLDRFAAMAPQTTPGTAWAYSNTGFIIAGACVERLSALSFQDAVRRELWTPLGMLDASFGAPHGPGDPWGHLPEGENVRPVAPDDPSADNPSFFDPAGCANMTLNAWARFAHEHLAGSRGAGRLLSVDQYARLHTPVLHGNPYALGWGAQIRDGTLMQLTHNGSNGLWFADIRVYPQSGYVFLMTTNDGRGKHEAATRDLRRILVERFKPIPDV